MSQLLKALAKSRRLSTHQSYRVAITKCKATKMRDIKFRALDEDGDMDYGNNSYIFDMYEDSEVMQYTGLKDKNGVEIYEGDLFGVTNLSDELEIVGEVIFDTDFAQFTIKYTNGGWAELWQHLQVETNKVKEVVGNIYEDKELLK